ncbi:Type 1 glutamine amidotransferase-like domain-containing protein [Phytomonospora endophytica]|uniref:Dipeptidase E n=1 Tax=Phytomonospora endophytica TaxID=714109 RepID=A0A841G1A9_9ACTN|nr:Type 1 glutamine amidotransferase-like domain-containing protein [Phytomonospora endophytica]MBB6039718.1 dipeptidase E [Phytomonospora endophytica]GIG70946.1 hypothetical protein Pen01_72410 [Phytomonospora endophytica]
MRALLTSSGITNGAIGAALVELLGRPVAESSALVIPTALHPFPGGPEMAYRALSPESRTRFGALGWKSLGILELTALPSIDPDVWTPAVRAADALLVCGGDPLFLAGWMRRSGLAGLLPTMRPEAVYVGVSAGSIAAASTFVETYTEPPHGNDGPWESEAVEFEGGVDRILVKGQGAGLVDFAVIPHLENPGHPDASLANAEKWAARIPAPTYAIDDDSAVAVADGDVRVVSEGQWRLFA